MKVLRNSVILFLLASTLATSIFIINLIAKLPNQAMSTWLAFNYAITIICSSYYLWNKLKNKG